MGEHSLCEHLAELNAFLVEAVQVPAESLEHDLVLEMSEQCAERCRVQLIADDDAGRTAALEVLVQILIRFAAGKGNDLRSDIGAELLLARGAFDGDVIADLAVTEADELQRCDIRSLMAADRRSAGRVCPARRK